jgi:hypothetical protein
MQPKETSEQILRHIDATVQALNMIALARYEQLLLNCGVQQPRIFQAFFLP